ncbi:MAG: hypothetical protein JW874_11350 [Spirochaetales bacterium]|nr:hypothetical protein [Spirochaetales bacterium]
MKTRHFFLLLLVIAMPYTALAQERSIRIDSLPATIEEFLQLRDSIADTPLGGAMMFVCAMIMYGQNEELGLQAFTIALDKSEVSAGTVYKGYKPAYKWNYYFGQVQKFPFLGYIYIDGTDYRNGYIPQSAPYSISFIEVRELAADQMKLFINTTSGNMARPLIMIQNTSGIWKVKDATSLFVGPSRMPPVEKETDDL